MAFSEKLNCWLFWGQIGKLLLFIRQEEETEVPPSSALPCRQARRGAESPAHAQWVAKTAALPLRSFIFRLVYFDKNGCCLFF